MYVFYLSEHADGADDFSLESELDIDAVFDRYSFAGDISYIGYRFYLQRAAAQASLELGYEFLYLRRRRVADADTDDVIGMDAGRCV